MSAPNVTLSWQGPEGTVAVITMDAEENRFDLDVAAKGAAGGVLARMVKAKGPVALAVTGEPGEIADVAAWALSEAPPFMTGAVLTVDGAMTTP